MLLFACFFLLFCAFYVDWLWSVVVDCSLWCVVCCVLFVFVLRNLCWCVVLWLSSLFDAVLLFIGVDCSYALFPVIVFNRCCVL